LPCDVAREHECGEYRQHQRWECFQQSRHWLSEVKRTLLKPYNERSRMHTRFSIPTETANAQDGLS
jgi:hypothetical protein